MRCPRCQGSMVHDRFMDLLDDTGQLHCDGWRCVNCGAIVDSAILRNRSHVSAHTSDRGRQRARSRKAWGHYAILLRG